MLCKLQQAFFSSIAKLQVKGFVSKLKNLKADKVLYTLQASIEVNRVPTHSISLHSDGQHSAFATPSKRR
jgi:hypothetical protein